MSSGSETMERRKLGSIRGQPHNPLTKETVSGQWNTIDEFMCVCATTESAVRGAQMGQLMARDATCIKDTIPSISKVN